MAIGTVRHFPLGISTEDRWGAARRRRLLAICAICALVAAGFAIVGRARLITMKPVDAGRRPATSEAPVEPPGVWYKTEKPDQTQVVTEAAIAPLAAPVSPDTAAQIESPRSSTRALAPEPPRPPTILRGAGTNPREQLRHSGRCLRQRLPLELVRSPGKARSWYSKSGRTADEP